MFMGHRIYELLLDSITKKHGYKVTSTDSRMMFQLDNSNNVIEHAIERYFAETPKSE